MSVLAYLSDVEHLFDEGVLLKDLTKRLSFSGIEVGFLAEVTLPEPVQPVVGVFQSVALTGVVRQRSIFSEKARA